MRDALFARHRCCSQSFQSAFLESWGVHREACRIAKSRQQAAALSPSCFSCRARIPHACSPGGGQMPPCHVRWAIAQASPQPLACLPGALWCGPGGHGSLPRPPDEKEREMLRVWFWWLGRCCATTLGGPNAPCAKHPARELYTSPPSHQRVRIITVALALGGSRWRVWGQQVSPARE